MTEHKPTLPVGRITDPSDGETSAALSSFCLLADLAPVGVVLLPPRCGPQVLVSA